MSGLEDLYKSQTEELAKRYSQYPAIFANFLVTRPQYYSKYFKFFQKAENGIREFQSLAKIMYFIYKGEPWHPGFVKEFGLVFLEDNLDGFIKLIGDSGFNPLINKAAKYGSQKIFEFCKINWGLKAKLKSAVKGGNTVIIRDAFKEDSNDQVKVMGNCLRYRHLDAYQWLLDQGFSLLDKYFFFQLGIHAFPSS